MASSQTPCQAATTPEITMECSDLEVTIPSTTRRQFFVKDILIAFAVSVLPLLSFSALLLCLLRLYRVKLQDDDDPRLQGASEHFNKGIIYIDLSATIFTTVGSWSSTVAPLSLPFILAIASYPAAKMILRASDGNGADKLPTPYQIALILRVLSNSSLSSVWHCMVYMFAKRKRAPRSSALTVMVCTLVLGTIQSIFIFTTDTWLHVTTETVAVSQFSPFTHTNASFGMPPRCTNVSSYNDVSSRCNSLVGEDEDVKAASKVVQEVLANSSQKATIQAYDEGGHKYAYIAPSINSRIDYVATTFAAKTNCSPVTSRCFNRDDFGDAKPKHFHCDFGMDGTVDLVNVSNSGLGSLTLAYYQNSPAFNHTMSSETQATVDVRNPHKVGVVVGMSRNNGRPLYDEDDDVFGYVNEPTIIALLCESMVFDVQYVSVNGSITSFSASPSNSSTAMAMGMTHTINGFNKFFILQRTIADLWLSSRAQQVSEKFSYTYSQAFLAASTAFIETRPAEAAQLRYTMLLAAVPVAPLVCLLVANVLVVLLAIILTVGALIEVKKLEEVGDVQTRLSIDALVAAHFETGRKKSDSRTTEEMFEEYQGGDGPRVKVEKTSEEGWKLVSCDSFVTL